MNTRKGLSLLVPGTGIEPVQRQAPRDFKSLASTNSATRAICAGSGIVYTFTKFLARLEEWGLFRRNIHYLAVFRISGLSRISAPGW